MKKLPESGKSVKSSSSLAGIFANWMGWKNFLAG
jgi:hypothetical protein